MELIKENVSSAFYSFIAQITENEENLEVGEIDIILIYETENEEKQVFHSVSQFLEQGWTDEMISVYSYILYRRKIMDLDPLADTIRKTMEKCTAPQSIETSLFLAETEEEIVTKSIDFFDKEIDSIRRNDGKIKGFVFFAVLGDTHIEDTELAIQKVMVTKNRVMSTSAKTSIKTLEKLVCLHIKKNGKDADEINEIIVNMKKKFPENVKYSKGMEGKSGEI